MSEVVLFPDHPHELYLGGRDFRWLSPYRYAWEIHGARYRITGPAGFPYDGASVPNAARIFVPPEPLHRAAGIHDLIYRYAGHLPAGMHEVLTRDGWQTVGIPWSRWEADRLFGRMLREDPAGPRRWQRRMGYRAVRAGGWWSWQNHRNRGLGL